MEVKKEEVKVNDIIRDVYCLMKNTAEKKNMKIIIEGEDVPNFYRR